MNERCECSVCRAVRPTDEDRVCDDPILLIRVAIARALRECDVPGDHKEITDRAVDCLPDFFRQPLMGAEDNA
jgi:hypothetical protein